MKLVLAFILAFSFCSGALAQDRELDYQGAVNWGEFRKYVNQKNDEDEKLGLGYIISGAIAAVGGITAFDFHPDGKVSARPVRITEETHFNLEDNLLLFFTGYSRSASAILKDQNDKS